MAFLRFLRVVLVVAGLGLAATGLIMMAVFGGTGTTGGHVVARWWCEPDGDNVECQTSDVGYAGPRGVIDGLTWLGYSIGGVALIGAAIALGQFDRPRPPSAPGSRYQASPGHQPAQAARPPGSW